MWLKDRLASLVTGLGTAKDKTTTAVHLHVPRDRGELEAAYRDNPFVRKGVDIIPFDMLRAWRAWQAKDDEVQAIEAAETALNLPGKLMAAMIRGRLYGGGAILVGDGAADPTQELVIERMGKGSIRYLNVFNRFEITAGAINRDMTSPYYGEPTYYEVTAAGARQRIHPSRIIRFLGDPFADETLHQTNLWSDSVLQSRLDTVDQATSALAYIAAMLPEAKQDIISVPGLSQHLASPDATARLTERFAYAARMKSMFGMLLLEGDGKSPDGELYQQKQLSFASLPDIARLYLQTVSGAFDIPATRFLSQSPGGMNSTGDSDTRNFYDNLAARQRVELSPSIRRLDRMLIRHALGSEPAGVWYNWNPLYQPSDKEKADTGKTKADTVVALVGAGVVPDEVLAEGVKGWLINSDIFPGIEAAYDKWKGDLVEEVEEEPLPGDNVVPLRRQVATDAAPQTLYVHRPVENGAEILAWARSQGFGETLAASDLHVTIAFSRKPVDWFAVGTAEDKVVVPRGGPRQMERFRDATVLLFSDWSIRWRHESLREAGASWDYPEYQPHITIAYGADVDLTKIEPYQGKIVFGPEVFAPVDENWKAKVVAE
jgi:hypothetical protein